MFFAVFSFDFFLFMYVLQHCFICCPSDFTVSEDGGIEPKTVATSALTADALTFRLDFIPASQKGERRSERKGGSHWCLSDDVRGGVGEK
jgi:hypothetical protein